MTSQKKINLTLASVAIAISSVILLSSWDFKQASPFMEDQHQVRDTIPKKEKKVRDLDDVLDNLDAIELKVDMEKVQKEINEAMKKLDMEKIRMDVQNAIKEIDMDKIRKEVETSLAKVDWDKIKAEVDKVKEIDMKKLEVDMKKMEEEMKKIKPDLEKSLEKAKVEIEKAKVEVKEYKDFVDGLENDGLINKKENYTIVHKDGELIVNDKKVSDEIYKKYRPFLEKHKKLNIKKSENDFNVNKN